MNVASFVCFSVKLRLTDCLLHVTAATAAAAALVNRRRCHSNQSVLIKLTSFSALTVLVGDRKDIRPVKNLVAAIIKGSLGAFSAPVLRWNDL